MAGPGPPPTPVTLYSLLTTRYSLLATRYSLLTTHYSLLTTYYSLLTTHYLLLTTYYSPLTTHYSLVMSNNTLTATLLRRTSRTSAISMVTVAMVLLATAPTSAHETGAIHLASNQVPIGGTIDIRGEKLPKSETLKLELRGILDTYPLGNVQTDTGGAFHAQISVPANVPAAQYTLAAVASDGDVTARADLTVVAAGAASTAAAGGMAGMPGMAGMSGQQATKDLMHIDRTTTTSEWLVIYTIIVLSLVVGLLLLRSSATAHQPAPAHSQRSH
jgi:hypothetical protein